jgi:Ni/Co efflux regulator RcnB
LLAITPEEDIMNKLVLVLATVATFGLGTAAFAASPSTASTQERVQPAQSQASGAHKMKASHRAGTKKVMVGHHRTVHLKASHARHYRHDNGKKVVVKHVPANKTTKTKASS